MDRVAEKYIVQGSLLWHLPRATRVAVSTGCHTGSRGKRVPGAGADLALKDSLVCGKKQVT